jgi:hypothetical protein
MGILDAATNAGVDTRFPMAVTSWINNLPITRYQKAALLLEYLDATHQQLTDQIRNQATSFRALLTTPKELP